MNQKPTVAIIGVRGYPSYYGGFETAVRKLVPYLVSENWKVRVYSRELKSRTRIEMENIEIVRARGINSKRLSTITFGLFSSVHSLFSRPDIALILNVANCIWLPLLKLRSIPIVVNVDGIEWEREKWGPLARKVFLLGARMTAKYADELIFDSKEIGKYWMNAYGRSGSFIPYGGEIRPHANSQNTEANPFLLLVSRLVPENSIEPILIAFEQLQKVIPIQIVGNAASNLEYISKISEMCERYAHVTWKGHISSELELFTLWEDCSIYLHGHTVGGTNPALVQAMASGCSIIAVDTVFNREVLGDAGMYCSGTPEDIQAKVLFLINDAQLRLTFSKSAQERARKFYNWDSVNASYQKLLIETVSNSKGETE